MKQSTRLWSLVAVLVLCSPAATQARDWFVRGGDPAAGGDGSREKPFYDPWQALEAAESGDVIHIAAGVYNGKLECGNWVIQAPRLTLLGGYDAGFTARDPWTHLTQFRFHPQFQGRNSGTLIQGTGDHSNLVLDGLLLDPADRNFYRPGQFPSLVPSAIPDRMLSLSSPGVQVRNCIFLNGGTGGVTIANDGARFENNLLLNRAGTSVLEIRANRPEKPAVVRGNIFAFAWEPKPAAVIIGTPADVTDNLFLGCLDHAISIGVTPEQVSLANNTFMMNRGSHVRYQLKNGQSGQIGDANLGDLEDIGLKSVEGVEAVDPALPGLDKDWLERFTQRYIFLQEGTTADKLNHLRKAAGLSPAVMPPPEGAPVGGFAPQYDSGKAAALVPATAARGARRVKLDVNLAPAAPSPAHPYTPATWEALAQQPQTLAGKRVAIKGLFGGEQSQFPFAGIKEDQYRGVRFHDPARKETGLVPLVYVKRGSRVQRAVTDQALVENVIPRHYIVRGIVHHDPNVSGRFKGTMVVESVELYTPDVAPRPRASGKHLYVRAGGIGGTGAKDKPFKDPFQALEAAAPGDTIHVAEGEYFGKLNRGSWDIDKKDLALLGGYTKDFTARDPWKHPTRLGYRAAASGGGQKPSNYLIGTADHTGLIVDGFVFDGRDINTYREKDQQLDADASPLGPLIRLWASPDCIIRNCVFVNGSAEAVLMTGPNTLVENNIIFNTYGRALQSRVQQNAAPNIIRNNTILFSWTGRAGQSASSGAGVYIIGNESSVIVDRNLIGYCDGPAVFFNGDPHYIRLTDNIFVNNLFANFGDSKLVLLHDRSLSRLAEVGFAAAHNNRAANPALPLDKTFIEGYIARSSGPETNITPARWNAIRKAFGLPEAAAGDAPATKPSADDKPPAPPSVDDLLARLESIKPAEKTSGAAPTVVIFCPVYDWKKAMELIDLPVAEGIGARRVELKPAAP